MTGKKKIAVAFSVTVPVVVICGLGLWGRFTSRPPEFDANSPEKAVDYLTSERFVRLSTDDKRRYIEQIRGSYSETPLLTFIYNTKISEPQRLKLMENVLPVIGPMVSRRIDEFEKLSPQEQAARLDAIIDQMGSFNQENGGRILSPQRLALVLQYLDPYTRARLRKHIPKLIKRMVERGISSVK